MAAESYHPILDYADDLSGITVCHKDESIDVYGGRGTNGRNLRNTPPGEYGWLGNPFRLDTHGDRSEVIARYVPVFYEKLHLDPEFRAAIKALDGKRVGCWCRHSDQTHPHCHLDVIDQFLKGGRLYVKRYLTEKLGTVPDGDRAVRLR